MPKIDDNVGINYNKGTKRVNSVAPGCTIEYEADLDEERDERVRKAARKRSQETNAALLAVNQAREEMGIQRPGNIRIIEAPCTNFSGRLTFCIFDNP